MITVYIALYAFHYSLCRYIKYTVTFCIADLPSTSGLKVVSQFQHRKLAGIILIITVTSVS